MELTAAVALIALICAWWIIRAKARQQANPRPTADYRPIRPALRTDLPPENTCPSEPVVTAEPKQARPYAAIADPSGGVREISAEEVSALFRPIQTMVASLRKTAVNSTRVAQTFAQSGGPTPVVENYRRAHREAVGLTEKTERLVDVIYFENEASLKKYQEVLDRIIDVEMELEDNLALIAEVEHKIASGDFLPIKRMGR